MKRALWLASWFPNRLDPLSGDFIERHALAASLYNEIYVIHLVKDDKGLVPGSKFREAKIFNTQCRAEIIYYKGRFKGIGWLHKMHSNILYYFYFFRAIQSFIKTEGRPDAIHVHIALKAGLMALYMKICHKIPYLVSEQWTGLCPEARPNLDDHSRIFRWLWKKVMKNANSWSAVSRYLGDAIQKKFGLSAYRVIPNVVDTEIFYPGTNLQGLFAFIHVSTMNYQKNPQQIFQAISILKKKTPQLFVVYLFGGISPALQALAAELDILDRIEIRTPCPQPELAATMRNSQALILYSRFETFGCVIIEANACGIPVIVSDIPVLHENVVDGITGVFVPLNEPTALAEKMWWIMQHHREFLADTMISRTIQTYGYAIIGKQFESLYQSFENSMGPK